MIEWLDSLWIVDQLAKILDWAGEYWPIAVLVICQLVSLLTVGLICLVIAIINAISEWMWKREEEKNKWSARND